MSIGPFVANRTDTEQKKWDLQMFLRWTIPSLQTCELSLCFGRISRGVISAYLSYKYTQECTYVYVMRQILVTIRYPFKLLGLSWLQYSLDTLLSDIFTVMSIKIMVFWYVTPCSLGDMGLCLGRTCCLRDLLHLIKQVISQKTAVLFGKVSCYNLLFILLMSFLTIVRCTNEDWKAIVWHIPLKWKYII